MKLKNLFDKTLVVFFNTFFYIYILIILVISKNKDLNTDSIAQKFRRIINENK